MSLKEPPGALVPQFEPLVGRSGLHVRDPIEDVQTLLYSEEAVEPAAVSADEFVFPVDSAVEIEVSRLRTPSVVSIWVRDEDGNQLIEYAPGDEAFSAPVDEYFLEISGLPLKIYVHVVGSSFDVTTSERTIEVSFGAPSRVRVGARSNHTQPAYTLETTRDPVDLMRTISLFGNAMKTWSPERTWPSLRGHPPLVELGTENESPSYLEPPDTGIGISVPPEHAWLYPATPLAWWLGATVEPGEPALHVGDRTYPLGVDGGYQDRSPRIAFERHVRDVLQFSFRLDCAVRTEGFYTAPLDVRRRIEAGDVQIDFPELYEAPLVERLQRYLQLAEEYTFEGLASRIGRPGWRLTADMQPAPERAEILPFLARDLAVVRCPTDRMLTPDGDSSQVVSDVRGGGSGTPGSGRGEVTDVATRTTTRSSADPPMSRDRVIQLPDTESMSQAWIGDGFATHAAKASTTSYLRRLENYADSSHGISIDIVVNDDEMTDEGTVSEIYGTRDHLSFDVDVHGALSVDELASVLERDTDFVHYIGHVDPEGFRCTDGYLQGEQLQSVGMDAFVLNACASYEQGQLLVDKGAIAGVITLEDVINSMATKIGQSIARLLNYGFPIGSATNLIQETIFTGSNYAVVGDSNASIVQSNIPVPNVARIESGDDGGFDVTVETYASWNFDIGTMYSPYIDSCDRYYVVPGTLDRWEVDRASLDRFLDTSVFPVIAESSLHWSDRITAAELDAALSEYSE